MRVALGVSYRGQAYHGWQSQVDRQTVQDVLEAALSEFAAQPIRTLCAGRTDTGVHGLNQVVHFDTEVAREAASWVRGTNRYLPADVAIQWCEFPGDDFHARFSAQGRRYVFLVLESAVRPAIEAGGVGWVFRALDGDAMRAAASLLLGEHDFSAFRAVQCQAKSPVKTIRAIEISRRGAYWRFDFDASAFLHHMVRNIMGCLIAVGNGTQSREWLAEVLAGRDRKRAAPTFPADGLYFKGPYYEPQFQIPEHTAAMDWLP
ncbi:tRNA pseudouridine(38-40) synthase TruA [Roseateles koreensis]|uniref:tRNA pseudouridine synthase A n=1 Tax=Roseateles koreensis TaxID=2987526 RepID=A0ABT5KTF9_9BURK|nr:tRNA pseudouridine(38-40) synthase TruA [Roseateles koreensis]MDC8786219.1 tRNA pseudouridine(38-40) synthase TruA [Roseateles koreensis]